MNKYQRTIARAVSNEMINNEMCGIKKSFYKERKTFRNVIVKPSKSFLKFKKEIMATGKCEDLQAECYIVNYCDVWLCGGCTCLPQCKEIRNALVGR